MPGQPDPCSERSRSQFAAAQDVENHDQSYHACQAHHEQNMGRNGHRVRHIADRYSLYNGENPRGRHTLKNLTKEIGIMEKIDDDEGIRFFQGVVCALIFSVPLWIMIVYAYRWLRA